MTSSKAQPAPAQKSKLKPLVFGRYLLLDRVAAGGMAEVWRAKQFGAEDFQRIIAIKKILPHVVEDPEFIQMFKDEAKITVQLQHANIGQVYELNKVDETFYIAMEYISGKDAKTLWSYCRQKNEVLPINLSCLIVQKMCEGLDYAHRKKDNFGVDLKIVHRDVSPQNVLISWEGEVKVIDFGIAKAAGKASKTQAGILKGKFGYMAPEQVRGMPLDQRADVFALGVCLYELVTGERAFVADSDFSLLEMVRNVEIKPPSLTNQSLPAEVERIIYKALAKDVDDRYQWGSDMAEDLQRYLLMQGKSPSRNDLAEYLRSSFPGDYDRERLRMESYRDIEMPAIPVPAAPAPAAAPAPPPMDSASAAVMAAMSEDNGGPVAPATNTGPVPNTNSATQPGAPRPGATPPPPAAARREVTSIRGPAVAAPPPVVAPAAKPINKKLIPIVAGVVGVVVLLAVVIGLLWKGSGTVAIVTQPDGAEVYINGELKGTTNGELVIAGVTAGNVSIRVQKDKYLPTSFSTNLKSGATYRQNVKLDRLPDPTGLLAVRSKPGGAAIWLDGADTGKVTPAELEVTFGDHTVELRKDKYKKLEQAVKIDSDAKVQKDLQLRPDRVDLEIRTVPSGAKVYDSSKSELGVTPWVFKDLSMDPPFPQVVFKRAGCKEKSLTIVPDEMGEAEQDKTFELDCN